MLLPHTTGDQFIQQLGLDLPLLQFENHKEKDISQDPLNYEDKPNLYFEEIPRRLEPIWEDEDDVGWVDGRHYNQSETTVKSESDKLESPLEKIFNDFSNSSKDKKISSTKIRIEGKDDMSLFSNLCQKFPGLPETAAFSMKSLQGYQVTSCPVSLLVCLFVCLFVCYFFFFFIFFLPVPFFQVFGMVSLEDFVNGQALAEVSAWRLEGDEKRCSLEVLLPGLGLEEAYRRVSLYYSDTVNCLWKITGQWREALLGDWGGGRRLGQEEAGRKREAEEAFSNDDDALQGSIKEGREERGDEMARMERVEGDDGAEIMEFWKTQLEEEERGEDLEEGEDSSKGLIPITTQKKPYSHSNSRTGRPKSESKNRVLSYQNKTAFAEKKQAALEKAKSELQSGVHTSIRAAAKANSTAEVKLARTTLVDYMKAPPGKAFRAKRGNTCKLLTPDQEQEVVTFIRKRSELGSGLNFRQASYANFNLI